MGAFFTLLLIGLTLPLWLSIDTERGRLVFATIVFIGLVALWVGLIRHHRRMREIDADFRAIQREAEQFERRQP